VAHLASRFNCSLPDARFRFADIILGRVFHGQLRRAQHTLASYKASAADRVASRGGEANESLLSHAAKNGDFWLANDILMSDVSSAKQAGPYPEYSGFHETPLMTCARLGHVQMCQLLIACNADINGIRPQKETQEETPLCCSARSGHLEICELLLESKADVNAQSYFEDRPVGIAAEKGHLEVFKLLLDRKADVRAVDEQCRGVLANAAFCGQVEIFKLFIASKVLEIDEVFEEEEEQKELEVEEKSETQLDVEEVQEEEEDEEEAEQKRYEAEQKVRQKKLRKQRHDARQKKGILGGALALASKNGHAELCRLLIDAGADIEFEFQGFTALTWALKCFEPSHSPSTCDAAKQIETFKLLLAAKANVAGETLFISPSLEVLKICLEAGADVNARTRRNGWSSCTPLRSAAARGQLDYCKLFLDFKADVNARTCDGETALHRTCLFNVYDDHVAVCELLVACNADVNAKYNDGKQPPLIICAERYGQSSLDEREKYVQFFQILVAAKADVNAENEDGNTALALLATVDDKRFYGRTSKTFDFDCCKLLVAAKADVNAKFTASRRDRDDSDEHGNHVLTLFAVAGRIEVCKLLLAAKADVNITNDSQETALMKCAYIGLVESCKILVAAKADVSLRDSEYHWTALDFAHNQTNRDHNRRVMGMSRKQLPPINWDAKSEAVSYLISLKIARLAAIAEACRLGGKGSMRRKKAAIHKTSRAQDDSRVQHALKRFHLNEAVPGFDEVSFFKHDGTIIHFNAPKVRMSGGASSIFLVSGKGEIMNTQSFRSRSPSINVASQ
jgi:ankyrin repeat protein